MSSTKLSINNRFVSISVPSKPKDKIYIPFKKNHKEKSYFVGLDKGKSSNVDVEVSKPMSKPIIR